MIEPFNNCLADNPLVDFHGISCFSFTQNAAVERFSPRAARGENTLRPLVRPVLVSFDHLQEHTSQIGVHKARTGADGNEGRSGPLTWTSRTHSESSLDSGPCVEVKPHPGFLNSVLCNPVHTTMRPHGHCVDHHIGDVDSPVFIHHVVVLVHMQDVSGSWQLPLSDKDAPLPESLGMVFHHDVHRSLCPFQQLRENCRGICEEIEVVQVNVEDRTHLSLWSNVTRFTRRAPRPTIYPSGEKSSPEVSTAPRGAVGCKRWLGGLAS